MKIKTLLKGVNVLNKNKICNIKITNICISTKDVKNGSLFICLKGEKHNGHDFLNKAKSLGAVAFVVEEIDSNFDGVQILVKNTRQELSTIAKNFYKPKSSLKIIGITGTNGKTTTSFLFNNILKCAGKRVGVIGTEGIFYNNIKISHNMTTPDPIELFKYLSLMSKAKIEYVVMEVSAHAIYYNKISAINFYAKAISNITPDHLDFFKTMENYANTKVGFIGYGNCIKVINLDDECLQQLPLTNKMYTISKTEGADVFAYDYSEDFSSYCLNIFEKEIKVKTKLLGEYNVENVLMASTIAKLIGVNYKHIKQGVETFMSVDGRMNIFYKENKMVVIDFAHTPDAMKKVLLTIKQFLKGNLFCVFGCGGSRDAEKRKIMGEISASLCNMVYITNDNPRNEEPEYIANQIASGIKTQNYQIILDRKEAIKTAINALKDGDVLAILGKGAENYIEIKGVKHAYLDRIEVEKWGFRR